MLSLHLLSVISLSGFGFCSMKWVELKMGELGVLNNPNYKITALLDHLAMITVQSDSRGIFDCKPLGLIWALLPEVLLSHHHHRYLCCYNLYSLSHGYDLLLYCSSTTPKTPSCSMICEGTS